MKASDAAAIPRGYRGFQAVLLLTAFSIIPGCQSPYLPLPQELRIYRAVEFNANGGTGVMTPQSIAAGSSAKLKANGFSRTGFTFGGWNTAANGSGLDFADRVEYTLNKSGVILYAQWLQVPDLLTTIEVDTADSPISFSVALTRVPAWKWL